ncbi:hypothetical protein [Maritalea porphyrae]|uniref:Uncharacterized protein n=1 Tax=Maritalea porphyrae TaxID=880732 RepID=A0ABQ5US00_9HYPH|nr:hypothetical protein [Maritalea porphyrae]GLQ17937.1 hypothetical protein GCM10007879_21860 [Maritalea porphyrae]
MKPTDPKWSDVANAYVSSNLTVLQICAKFSISRSQLYLRAKKECWPRRHPTEISEQHEFLETMFSVLHRQLEQLDRRISPERPVDAVQLGNIAKTFEKLVELRSTLKTSKSTKVESAAVHALREALAQNLARLNEPN